MNAYSVRWFLAWPLRLTIRSLLRLVAALPGMTYGEIASMSPGPCQRCVGLPIIGHPVSPLSAYPLPDHPNSPPL